MKFCSLHVRGFGQFKDTCLDFTDPSSGKPLDKVCLIGPNGTGKSLVLRMLMTTLNGISNCPPSDAFAGQPISIAQIESNGERFALCSVPLDPHTICYRSDVLAHPQFRRILEGEACYPEELPPDDFVQEPLLLALKPNDSDLVTLAIPDAASTLASDPPAATLNDALGLSKKFPAVHRVDTHGADSFWRLLIYLVNKREQDYRAFENRPENQKKTVEQVKAEFESENENILPVIAGLWDDILGRAGLELDLESVGIPVQLTDTLSAHVRTKRDHKRLQYNQLSTGIRNFLFRLGHIRALYFHRHISRGFALIDEPENSLFPDMLFGLVDTYLDLVENTQLFMATQSPIIAAQFRPVERCILEFDAEACTTCRRGVAPLGDDPNDLLRKDFSVRSIYGEAAIKKWERYREIKRALPDEDDIEVKNQMLDELSAIRSEYDFDPHEILG